MSKWTAVSDWDCEAESWEWLGAPTELTCRRCGFIWREFGRLEPLALIQPICSRCMVELEIEAKRKCSTNL